MKYQKIRKEIKTLSKIQKDLKEQRKTVNFKGIRSIEPYDALYKHEINRTKLRHLFRAYAILKGIEIPKPKKAFFDESIVNEMVIDYTVKQPEVKE